MCMFSWETDTGHCLGALLGHCWGTVRALLGHCTLPGNYALSDNVGTNVTLHGIKYAQILSCRHVREELAWLNSSHPGIGVQNGILPWLLSLLQCACCSGESAARCHVVLLFHCGLCSCLWNAGSLASSWWRLASYFHPLLLWFCIPLALRHLGLFSLGPWPFTSVALVVPVALHPSGLVAFWP